MRVVRHLLAGCRLGGAVCETECTSAGQIDVEKAPSRRRGVPTADCAGAGQGNRASARRQ
jgi:hypothetical protein